MIGRFFGAVVGAVLLFGLFRPTPQAWGGLNSCPIASPLSISVAGGGQVMFQLIAMDPDGDSLQYSVTSPPAHGVLVVQGATGAASYSPAAGYCGPDSFRFRVTDGMCNSNEATVFITVCPPPATATATSTATATATHTLTSTPTQTPRSIGEACTDGAQCASMFCVDGVCCDRACDTPDEVCDLPGRVGVCVALAPAPAMSWPAIVAGGCLLAVLARFQLRRRGRARRDG